MKTWKSRRGSPRSAAATGFNGATSMKTWKRKTPPPRSSRSWSFNGATSMKTWKRIQKRRLLPRPLQLQWGHVDEDVEERAARQAPPRRGRGFNGATSMKTWKSRRFDGTTKTHPCFNGATSMKTWKSSAELAMEFASFLLQWGHVDEDVEEGPPPGPFGAKDLGPGLREGRPAGVSKRSRARSMKS